MRACIWRPGRLEPGVFKTLGGAVWRMTRTKITITGN